MKRIPWLWRSSWQRRRSTRSSAPAGGARHRPDPDARQPAGPRAYKATIKGLTRSAIAGRAPSATARPSTGSRRSSRATAAPRERLATSTTDARGRGAGGAPGGGQTPPTDQCEPRRAQGGGRLRGTARRTGVNNDPMKQPDEKLRALNSRAEPADGPREEVYCTKVGTTRPDEMYIVGAHMDGHGWGEAANDDGSGTALVMELARIFSMPDVQTDRIDPLRAVEQRRDRPERRARLRRAARRRCRARRIRPDRPLSGTAVARHDPARHDDVRSRHAARRRHARVPSSGPKPT